MDVMFAKIVSDTAGKNHILIEGWIYEIVGSADTVNPVVETIVSALRRYRNEDCVSFAAMGSQSASAVSLDG